MDFRQLFYCFHDYANSSLSSHISCWVVYMASWPIPIPIFNWLWIEIYKHSIFLTDSCEQKSSYLHVISWSQKISWTNLVFSLSRHYFSICTCKLNSRMNASSSVCFHNFSSKHSFMPIPAVKLSLRLWISILWPSKRPFQPLVSSIKEVIFLFESKPQVLILHFLINLRCEISKICITRFHCFMSIVGPSVSIAKYEDIVSLSERIWKDGLWLYKDFRVCSNCLSSWWAIEIPNRKIRMWSYWFSFKNPRLWSEIDSSFINPNVFSYNLTLLI